METIELPHLAAAFSCQPRTLCRLIHGPFAARSLQKAPVSLALAAQALQMGEPALLSFLTATLTGKDEGLTLEFALMVTNKTKRTFYRQIKEGKIPVLVSVGRFTRFSREALKAIVS